MKKKSAAAVIAALIVVALGFFASFFLSFTDGKDENYTITLPGQGSAVIDTNPEMEQSNRDQLQTVQVDRSNVQAVIARLQRPASYQYQAETSYFYRESKTVLRSQVWKEDTRTRISQFTADGETGQQILLTESWVYLWGMEGAYVRYTRQTQDADGEHVGQHEGRILREHMHRAEYKRQQPALSSAVSAPDNEQ